MNIVQKVCTLLRQFVDNVVHIWTLDPAPREITGWELQNKLRVTVVAQELEELEELELEEQTAPPTVPPEIVTPAVGTRGHLLYLHGHNYFVFRVYTEGHGFKDYDIRHSDLCVIINDEDAHFYEGHNRMILDHSPETLGRT